MNTSRLLIGALVVLVLMLGACSVPKETLYFDTNGATDSSVHLTKIPPYIPSFIQPDDILAVKVQSISDFVDKTPVEIFNDGGIEYNITAEGGGGGGGGDALKAYLVDAEGNIDFPILGKIKVEGMTIRRVKDTITQLLQTYVKSPVVEVRILNYNITVLGEVKWPGVVVAPNHRINVLEAIGAAGDIMITGRRDNVMVIRETKEGYRQFCRVNLNSRDAFANPYFYLKQNDIVYVAASRAHRQTNNNSFVRFYLPLITSTVAAIVAVYAVTTIK